MNVMYDETYWTLTVVKMKYNGVIFDNEKTTRDHD